jgi:hypothetical protein
MTPSYCIAAYKMVVELTIPYRATKKYFSENNQIQEGGENRSYTPMDAHSYYTRARNFRILAQLSYGIKALQNTLHLSEIALGGTAVGTV